MYVCNGDGLHASLHGGHRHVGDVQPRGVAHLKDKHQNTHTHTHTQPHTHNRMRARARTTTRVRGCVCLCWNSSRRGDDAYQYDSIQRGERLEEAVDHGEVAGQDHCCNLMEQTREVGRLTRKGVFGEGYEHERIDPPWPPGTR